MGYRELIKRVQVLSGFSDKESKEALDHTVEVLAAHLSDNERKDFASQLPERLQDIALSIRPIIDKDEKGILKKYIATAGESIGEARAKKQLLSAWQALKDSISDGEIRHIRGQLPKDSAVLLH